MTLNFLDGVDGNEKHFIFCHHSDKVAIWFWIDEHTSWFYTFKNLLTQKILGRAEILRDYRWSNPLGWPTLQFTFRNIFLSYVDHKTQFPKCATMIHMWNLWLSTSWYNASSLIFPFILLDYYGRPILVRDANCYHDYVGGVEEIMYPLITIYSRSRGVGMLIPKKPMSSLKLMLKWIFQDRIYLP
jgi:hypothetical protein